MLQAFLRDDSGTTAIEFGLIASLISVGTVATVINWVLEQLIGPNVPENPNYEIIQDISSLVPWWYPHIIVGCTILFLILLWANKRRRTGGQHSSGESQDMEDRDVRISSWFTDPSRRNQSVEHPIMGNGQNSAASVIFRTTLPRDLGTSTPEDPLPMFLKPSRLFDGPVERGSVLSA